MGLTHPQFVVLATLGWLTRNGERVSQSDIGKMAKLDPNTISQIIKGLEQKALIKRVPASDGRAKNPILTTDGSQILMRAIPSVETADSKFLNALSHEERGYLIGLFQKLTPT